MEKVLILNGSPRMKGNTRTALKFIAEEINPHRYAVEFIDIPKHKVSDCIACDTCKTNGGFCFAQDDTNMLVEKFCDADIVILGSPVYWWGITGNTKSLIDKLYSKTGTGKLERKGKKFGMVAVGAAELEDPEFKIISSQFKCICDYLGWELIVDESISAGAPGDVEKEEKVINRMREIGKSL